MVEEPLEQQAPEEDLRTQHLEVYDGRGGLWHPEHGVLDDPEGWAFLPSGDAFVTRHVKKAGTYWVLYRPRGRNRPHRRLMGLLAPENAIAEARQAAAETEERRAKQRRSGARSRARAEQRYEAELEDAIVAFLGFAPEHEQLAHEIAAGAAHRAAQVGSGRVGRTRTITLEERAELAARAYIRHRHTDYEEQLERLRFGPLDAETMEDEIGEEELGSTRGAWGEPLGSADYAMVKHEAHAQVDAFLEEHRTS